MTRALFFLFLFSSFHVKAQTLSPADLKVISTAATHHSIIGLGEPEHYYKGFYNVKIQVVQQLIDDHKANTLILEAATASCRELDRYVKGANVNAAEILTLINDGYHFRKAGLFDAQEILDLLTWIREKNKNAENKISIYGMDFQQLALPVENLRKGFSKDPYVLAVLDTAQSRGDTALRTMLAAPVPFYTKAPWRQFATQHYATLSRLETYIQQHTKRKDLQEDVTQLKQFAFLYNDIRIMRDSMMAANVIRRMTPGTKAIIWAAGLHTGKDSLINNSGKMLFTGALLDHTYGKDYFRIALVDGEATEGQKRVPYPLTPQDPEYGKHDMIIYCTKGGDATPLKK